MFDKFNMPFCTGSLPDLYQDVQDIKTQLGNIIERLSALERLQSSNQVTFSAFQSKPSEFEAYQRVGLSLFNLSKFQTYNLHMRVIIQIYYQILANILI